MNFFLGLPFDEIESEFLKKLEDIDNQKSSTDAVLIEIERRYSEEKDVLTKKLQGLFGYNTMNSIERENLLFTLIQSRLRGTQENSFESCGVCIGLSERIKPLKHSR